jgi:tetratricopeptide (TPR) repeat protein
MIGTTLGLIALLATPVRPEATLVPPLLSTVAVQGSDRWPLYDLSVYLAAAAGYRTGDPERVLREVRRWAPADIVASIAALNGEAKRRRPVVLAADDVVVLPVPIDFDVVEAAALMHLHAGLLELQSFGPARAGSHLSAATRLVEWSHRVQQKRLELLAELKRPRDSTGEIDRARLQRLDSALSVELEIETRELYFALAAATLSLGFPEGALPFAEKAREAAPGDGDALLLEACARESLATEEELRTRTGRARRLRGEAEELFRETLAIDPARVEARLRLGHVLLTSGRPGEAVSLLRQAAEQARDSRQRYLALLFLGRASELQEDPNAAATSYRGAVEAWPESQAARLALARSLEASGGPAPARPLVMASLLDSRKPAREPDPWWSYPFGPDGVATAAIERLWQRVLGRPFAP